MRLKCMVAGFARLAGLDWEVEVEEVLPVPVVPFSVGERERLRLLTLAWGEVRESVALESVEFLRAGGGSFLVGAGESEEGVGRSPWIAFARDLQSTRPDFVVTQPRPATGAGHVLRQAIFCCAK